MDELDEFHGCPVDTMGKIKLKGLSSNSFPKRHGNCKHAEKSKDQLGWSVKHCSKREKQSYRVPVQKKERRNRRV